jgi:sigma-B regulation protein RsbU (phosphoserine phosphatase)
MATKKPTAKQLEALLRASKMLNSTLESDALLVHLLDSARSLSGADRSTLYLVDEGRQTISTKFVSGPQIESFQMLMGVGIAGHVIASGRSSRLRDAYRSPHFNRAQDRKTGYRTRSMLTVPFHGRDGQVAGAIQAINQVRRGFFDEREQAILEQLGEYAALALENARYVEALKEIRRMEEDLLAARRIQQTMLPSRIPEIADVELGTIYIPCLAVGGDLYDALTLSNGHLAFSLGDISGKGLTAAMMMANLQSLLRAEARRGSAPNEALATMNEVFHDLSEATKFATFFYGVLDPQSGHLRFSSAGHDPMIVMHADGELAEVPLGGPPLGMLSGMDFPDHSVDLKPGDLCLVYSDGITEQSNARDEMFQQERLVDTLRACIGLPAATCVARVRQAVLDFAGDRPAGDDFTIVALRWRVSA